MVSPASQLCFPARRVVFNAPRSRLGQAARASAAVLRNAQNPRRFEGTAGLGRSRQPQGGDVSILRAYLSTWPLVMAIATVGFTQTTAKHTFLPSAVCFV